MTLPETIWRASKCSAFCERIGYRLERLHLLDGFSGDG